MKILIFIPLLVIAACTSQQQIDDSPRYGGARYSSAEAGGAYQVIRGQAESGGCGAGMSENAVQGRLVIDVKTPECNLHLETGTQTER